MDPPRRKRHPQPDGRTAASLRARDTAPPSPAPPDEPLPDDPLDLEASAPCNPQPVTCNLFPATCNLPQEGNTPHLLPSNSR
jgi:hypothetical protein